MNSMNSADCVVGVQRHEDCVFSIKALQNVTCAMDPENEFDKRTSRQIIDISDWKYIGTTNSGTDAIE